MITEKRLALKKAIVTNNNIKLYLVSGNRELTLKCKFKCYIKPMKDPLGVSPSKGNQGTTPRKEKFF